MTSQNSRMHEANRYKRAWPIALQGCTAAASLPVSPTWTRSIHGSGQPQHALGAERASKPGRCDNFLPLTEAIGDMGQRAQRRSEHREVHGGPHGCRSIACGGVGAYQSSLVRACPVAKSVGFAAPLANALRYPRNLRHFSFHGTPNSP